MCIILQYYLFLLLVIGMAVFKDPCSDLPQTIDIGGDIYFLGPEKSIDLAFKSREQFLKAFVENKENTERTFLFLFKVF